MKKIETSCEIDVEFYDLDPMNVVWHGNYIKYLEKARCDMLEKLGYSYEDMKKDGCVYPVAKMELKFVKPVEFKQKLVVKSRIERVEPSLEIKYKIVDKNTGETVFKAKSMQIRVDINTRESLYTAPGRFLEKIEEFCA